MKMSILFQEGLVAPHTQMLLSGFVCTCKKSCSCEIDEIKTNPLARIEGCRKHRKAPLQDVHCLASKHWFEAGE